MTAITMLFFRSTDRLPAAHTCFNQLDLPAYEVILCYFFLGFRQHLSLNISLVLIFNFTTPNLQTYDKLRTYLLKAIQECSEGFGFA